MGRLVSVGFGNMVNSSKIIAVISPESAPVKRLIQAAKEEGSVLDVTQGRKTKSVIVMENGQYLLSALQTETIANRMQSGEKTEETYYFIFLNINSSGKGEEQNMLHPSYTDLMKVVNSEVEEGEQPVVNSRYSIVLATSKRARQLIDGEEAMVSDSGKKPLSVAIEELNKGEIKILPEDYEPELETEETEEAE